MAGRQHGHQPKDEALGLVDRMGYLYCSSCAERLGKTGEPVRSAPHRHESCESCGTVLDEADIRAAMDCAERAEYPVKAANLVDSLAGGEE